MDRVIKAAVPSKDLKFSFFFMEILSHFHFIIKKNNVPHLHL